MSDIASERPDGDVRWRLEESDSAELFWKSDDLSVDCINTTLAIVDRALIDYPTASLEFGCGGRRILLHLNDVGEQIELRDGDIDAESIGWLIENLPGVSFSLNDGRPALEVPNRHFDLVSNQSAFTHLDEEYHDLWLAEVRRVVKPGGDLVLSISGQCPWSQVITDRGNAVADATEL